MTFDQIAIFTAALGLFLWDRIRYDLVAILGTFLIVVVWPLS